MVELQSERVMQTTEARSRRHGHAVVIGSSMGGLLHARVLAGHFDRVTMVERDALPDAPEPRKGTPQARHVHVLLEAGKNVLDQLFPGIAQELLRAGATLVDAGRDVAWLHLGAWKIRYESGIETILCTRPLLEWHVRRRVRELGNVEIRERCAATGLLTDPARSQVTGVRLHGPGGEETLPADLVVDASGRGTHAPRWLDELGYGRPDVEAVDIDLAYASRVYRRPASFLGEWKLLMEYPRSPETWRAGLICNIENDRWLVTLNGYFGDHPPADDVGFLAFARSLPSPDLFHYLCEATPLTEVVVHKFPSSRWLRYDRLPGWPEGFVVTADAVCSFNPLFGQGMSVASLGARFLDECLTRTRARDLRGLAPRFQRRLPGIIRLPWLLATILDLHYPQARGARPVGLAALQWFVIRLVEQTSLDPRAHHHFNALLHLRSGIGGLLDPRLALPVLAYGVKSLFVPLERRANVDTLPPAPGEPIRTAGVRARREKA